MKRKLSLLTVLIMLCSLLTVGCNRVPTAQELVDNAFASMPQDKANLNMDMYMEMSAEAEMFGSSVTMSVVMDIDADVQSTLEVAYVSGDVSMEMFGMQIEQPMESYTDVNEGVVYSLSEDVWYKSPADTESVSQPSSGEMQELRAESFIDLVLVNEEDEEATEWVVTGILDYSKIMEVMGDDLLSSVGSTGVDTEALADLQLQVVMTFDRETETLKTMECTCDEENLQKFEMDGGSIDAFNFTFTFYDATDLIVEIPAEVKENAIDSSEMGIDLEL